MVGMFVEACWDMRPHGRYAQSGLVVVALFPTAMLLLGGMLIAGRSRDVDVEIPKLPKPTELLVLPSPPTQPLTTPVRDLLARFPSRSKMPSVSEGTASVSISKVDFSPQRDLVRVEDSRAWWESEHDRGDTEDDHMMHRALEEPLRRVIELVSKEGATLKIQDCYRESGVHSPNSLHKQGRAADLTCDDLGLERLAILCWSAGFDWVYYEAPRRGGHHIHVSVRP